MAIVHEQLPELEPREEVAIELGHLINDAVSSPDNVSPFSLAYKIMEFIEEKINSVDQYGEVIYRV